MSMFTVMDHLTYFQMESVGGPAEPTREAASSHCNQPTSAGMVRSWFRPTQTMVEIGKRPGGPKPTHRGRSGRRSSLVGAGQVARRLGIDGADAHRMLLDGGRGRDGLVYFDEASIDRYLGHHGYGVVARLRTELPTARTNLRVTAGYATTRRIREIMY